MASMNSLASAMSQQTLGAQVVSTTLDYMNQGSSIGSNASYDFQTKVLTAAMSDATQSSGTDTGVGTIINIIA